MFFHSSIHISLLVYLTARDSATEAVEAVYEKSWVSLQHRVHRKRSLKRSFNTPIKDYLCKGFPGRVVGLQRVARCYTVFENHSKMSHLTIFDCEPINFFDKMSH